MKVPTYRALGILAVALGAIGAVLPLLPTTPFLILAAYFFAHSHPEWEAKLLAISAAGGLLTLGEPWRYVPLAVGVVSLRGCGRGHRAD